MKLVLTILALTIFSSHGHAASPIIKAMAAKLEVICTDDYSIVRAINDGAPTLAQGGITWTSTDGLPLMPVGRNQIYAKYERTLRGERHLIEFLAKDHQEFGINLEARYSITNGDNHTVSASAITRLESTRMETYVKGGKSESPSLEVAINGRVPSEVEDMSEGERNAYLAQQGFRDGDFSHQGINCKLYRK